MIRVAIWLDNFFYGLSVKWAALVCRLGVHWSVATYKQIPGEFGTGSSKFDGYVCQRCRMMLEYEKHAPTFAKRRMLWMRDV